MAKKTKKASEVTPDAEQNSENVEPQMGGPSPAAVPNPSIRSDSSSDSTATAAASGEDPNKTQSITDEYSEDSERANGIKPEESANILSEDDQENVEEGTDKTDKSPEESISDTDKTDKSPEVEAPAPETPPTELPTPPAQKASAGRIVIYTPREGSPEANNGATEVPAVICRAWEAGLVNLRVFADGPDVTWVGSVIYSEEPKPHTWRWPARV